MANTKSGSPTRRVETETAHLYAKGQAVRLRNAVMSSGKVYLVTASLPPTGEALQYRIRNEEENFERVAREVDLEPVSASAQDHSQTAVENLFGRA